MFASTYLYTWVERGTVRANVFPENTIQCPLPGLEPKLLSPETCARAYKLKMLEIYFNVW